MDFFLSTRPDRTGRAPCFTASDLQAVTAFYDRDPPGSATPLVGLPGLAHRLGVGSLLLKDESARFGVNAFKITGVRYAVHRLLEPPRAASLELACVTTGNHGRAVARVAAEHGLRAHVVVPAGTVPARIAAIAREGADVIVSPDGYDAAVTALSQMVEERGWTIVSDTSWPGYDAVPRDIMAGYTRLLEEARRAWSAPPDVVAVQAGVGGLAAAVTGWLSLVYGSRRPFTIVCEPVGAACLLASARAGRRTTLAEVGITHMSGLRCGEPSPAAWETVYAGADAFVAIPDQHAEDAIGLLAHPLADDVALAAGSSGACGVATIAAVMREPFLAPLREAAGLGPESTVLAFVTEGVTDPEVYARSVQMPGSPRPIRP